MNQRKPMFVFPAGTGTLRAKYAGEDANFTVMLSGRVAIPGFGQCVVDGSRAKDAKEAVLTVRKLDGRRVVGQLELPVLGKGQNNVGSEVQGRFVATDEAGKPLPRKDQAKLGYAVLGQVRLGENGFYQALRLGKVVQNKFQPVKIAQAGF